MGVEVRVNGETYNRFKQIDSSRGVDTFAGEVRLIVSQPVNNKSTILIQDIITVFIESIQVFTGYIEKIGDTESRAAHDISFRARDTVSDLIDSNVTDNVKSLKKVSSFKELVQLCIDGLGLTDKISVIDNVGATFSDTAKLKAAETGQTVGEFLQENARQVQVFLNTDGKGNVLIQRPAGRLLTILQNVPNARNNNIKESSFKIDYSKRFNKYTIYSNSSLASESSTVNDLNNKGTATDDEIRKSKVYEKVADKPMSPEECKAAAEEEANVRRARSFSYSCSVAGLSANSELWEPGKEVIVKDEIKGVNGVFQINKCTWSYSRASGEVTKMDITLPDKLLVEANPTEEIERISLPSSTFGIQQGNASSQNVANFGVSNNSLVSSNTDINIEGSLKDSQQINTNTSGGVA